MGLCFNIASFFYIDKKIEKIEYIECVAKVISIKEEKEYVNKYVVKILRANMGIKNIKTIIYTEKDYDLIPGDVIYCEGEFSIPEHKRNYGGFDYNKYLKQSKIFGIIKIEEIRKISKQNSFNCVLENVRYKFLRKLDELYEDRNSEFLKSLLFGKTDGLDESIKENFRDSSLSHILAISGMHVTYVVLGINFILSKFIKYKKLKNRVLILSIIFFSFISGNSVSGVRACIMGVMTIVASDFERKNNFYFSIVYSFLIIILFNPYNIYNIGLWLSYMGSIGIVSYSTFFKICINRRIKSNKNEKFIIKKVKEYCIENFVVTVSAQILIFPIMMYVVNTVSISFFVSNILVSFFIGPLLILGYLSVFLSFVNVTFSKIIVLFIQELISIVIKISEICSKLPFSKIYVKTPSIIEMFLIYMIIGGVMYISFKKRLSFFKIIISKKNLKKEIQKLVKKINNIKKYIIILVVLLFFINFLIKLNECSIFKINFIDVGQGDCTYIKTFSGKNIIIDGR